MRFTNKLYAQHLDWWFKQQWKRAGQRIPIETNIKGELEKLGIKVVDAKSTLQETRPPQEFLQIDHVLPIRSAAEAATPAYVLRDENVLLAGIPQAQVLTKSIKFDSLPERIEEKLSKVKISPKTDESSRLAVIASHLLDAEQKKTAIIKIPERPAFVTPRNYAITDDRKIYLLSSKLISECEKLCGRSTRTENRIANNLKFHVNLNKRGDNLQMDFNVEMLITSKRPIPGVNKVPSVQELPDIHPLKDTVSIPKISTYKELSEYPIKSASSFGNPHTIILHFSPLTVKNLHGTPVTDSQFQARTMLKAFAVAAARAQQQTGVNAGDLEKPVVVQSIHTDGRQFHFGVFQLNTLNLDGHDGLKNYWFQKEPIALFEECKYVVGRPTLTGYSSEVMKHFFAFYSNK